VDWKFIVITAVVIFASVRAAEATLKLIGRYNIPPAAEE
jgi:hypothetical protein